MGFVEDGKIFGKRSDANDVRSVAAAGAFGVIGVNRAAGDRGDRGFEETGFVDRVGVDGNLDVEFVRDFQAGVDGGGRGAPVFMEFQPQAPASICSARGASGGGISFAEKTEIHRPRFGGLQHAREIPRAGRAGGGGGAGGGTCAAADHRGDAVRNGFVDLLRRDEMDVAVDAARGDDQVFTGDHFGGCADDKLRIDAVHRVGISGFADFHDAAVLDSDIGFDDAPMIEDDGVGDDQVERAMLADSRMARAALAHAVANHFAAAEGDFVAVVREVFFDFDDQIGVGQANAVAFGGAVEVGVGAAGNVQGSSAIFLLAELKACLRGLVRWRARARRTIASRRSPSRASVEAMDHAAASKLGELDFLFFAGLEAHGGSGRDIKAHAVGGRRDRMRGRDSSRRNG